MFKYQLAKIPKIFFWQRDNVWYPDQEEVMGKPWIMNWLTIHEAAMMGNTRAVSLLRTLTQLGTSSSRSEEGQQQLARGPPHWRLCLLRHFSPAATSFYKIQSWGPPFLETRPISWRIEGPAIIAPASICSTYDNTQETLVFIFWPRRVASGGMMGTGAADDGNSRVASGGMGAADGGNTWLSLTSCVLCLLWMVGLWGPLPIVYMCSDRHN